ncbi:MAG: hypothetical protein Q8O56_13910 [Solirubrobacteraceae bacterium]|nr:hypothetical protein [Solirubrobacteraceae bacterium]
MQNARYRGGSGTGVDLTVRLADGQLRLRHLEQGEALPTEIGGVPVDPEYITRLLEQYPEFEPDDDGTVGEDLTTDYDDMTVEELAALAADRDLDIQGTGAGGKVLKKDLVDALTAADTPDTPDNHHDDEKDGTS